MTVACVLKDRPIINQISNKNNAEKGIKLLQVFQCVRILFRLHGVHTAQFSAVALRRACSSSRQA